MLEEGKRQLRKSKAFQLGKEAVELLSAKKTTAFKLQFPPGHYYSPIPSLKEVERRESAIFATPDSIPGIDLREGEQLELIDEFAQYYDEVPFSSGKQPGVRYWFENDFFAYGDGVMLYSMLRHLRPARFIEVGSGFSSALILDVKDLFFEGKMTCTFIEPYPERLEGLLANRDRENVDIRVTSVQDIGTTVFETLASGDVLFIDSTHVSKVGSDVNYLFFEVLPRLAPGVVIHVHDIFYPFEYPREWIFAGRAWNENYLLRAFLTHNPEFRILLFNSFLATFHQERVSKTLPLWGRNPGGSIWLQRVP